ncbi:MAG: hypothetical protein HY319_26190 [Armatimonadetes bacterium]|nr:hypothetical protein [Armatimonadota bacterium]
MSDLAGEFSDLPLERAWCPHLRRPEYLQVVLGELLWCSHFLGAPDCDHACLDLLAGRRSGQGETH